MPLTRSSSSSRPEESARGASADSRQVFIIAGEASGDLHASMFIRALKALAPGIEISGIGGPGMIREGMRPLFPSSDLAVVGLVEILGHLGPILKAFRRTIRYLKDVRPQLLVLVDYPEFNMLVARKARKLGIPVFYYITPQVWAWRQGRVRRLKKLVDKMAVIFPFEQDFFRSRGLDATFVGHPLLDVVKMDMTREQFRAFHGIPEDAPLIGLLPGSRHSEVERLLPIMLETARHVAEKRKNARFILPLAPSIDPDSVPVEDINAAGVVLVKDKNYDAMGACDALLLASGTVALEAAILNIPMVVTYKVSPFTYRLGRALIKVPYVSLTNLVAGREVVPEILQDQAVPDVLCPALLKLLEPDVNKRIRAQLNEVKDALGSPGAADRAAALALSCI